MALKDYVPRPLRPLASAVFGLQYPTPNPNSPGQRGAMRRHTLYANPRAQTSEGWLNNPSLLVQRKSIRVFHEMRRDDMVKSALALKKLFIMVSGWTVEPPEQMANDAPAPDADPADKKKPKTAKAPPKAPGTPPEPKEDDDKPVGSTPPRKPEKDEITAFVEHNLKNLQGSLENALMQILTALDFGYSVTEKVYETAKEGPHAGKMVLKCLSTAAPDDMVFITDPYGALIAIDQQGNRAGGGAGTVDVPLSKFVVWAWDAEFGNWYGRSDLEAAHRPWLMKSQAYNWMGILLERFGIPPTFVHYDEQAIPEDVQASLKTAVEQWQSGAWGLIPRGENADSIGFYSPELAGQTGTVFIPAFKMMNDDIARALLVPGQLGMTPDNEVGSQAKSTVHLDVFMLIIEHARRQLADDVMNSQVIRQMVDLNFAGVTEYPKFKWLPLGDDIKADLLKLWGELTGQRVVQTTPADEDHIRKQLKFPDRATAQDTMADVDPAASGYGPGLQPTDPSNPLNPSNPESALNPANQPKPEKGPPPAKGKGGKKGFSADQGVPATIMRDHNPARALTNYERKVDFQAITRDFDELTSAYTDRLKGDLQAVEEALLAAVRRDYKPTLEYAMSLGVLPKTDPLYTDMAAFMKDGFGRGRDSLRRELPGAKFAKESLPMADLDDALAYIKTKALWVTKVTDEKILAEVRAVLMQAVGNGDTLDEVVKALREVFKPYVADSLDDRGVLLNPARLETIVRTNLTEVYNQGRLVQGSLADEYLEAWQYSAIIDTRTTEVCRHLDGRVFMADDKRVAGVRPPRHFNCRSVLVPIVVGETVEEGDKITDVQYDEAKRLAGKGF